MVMEPFPINGFGNMNLYFGIIKFAEQVIERTNA